MDTEASKEAARRQAAAGWVHGGSWGEQGTPGIPASEWAAAVTRESSAGGISSNREQQQQQWGVLTGAAPTVPHDLRLEQAAERGKLGPVSQVGVGVGCSRRGGGDGRSMSASQEGGHVRRNFIPFSSLPP